MNNIWQLLISLAGVTVIAGGLYLMGYSEGKQVTQSNYLTTQIKQLQAVLDDTKKLTKQAQEASTKLEQLISAKTEADIQTTKEFTNALKATKDSRVSCVFDERIMQQLTNARNRAAKAASTAKVDDLLPTTVSNDR